MQQTREVKTVTLSYQGHLLESHEFDPPYFKHTIQEEIMINYQGSAVFVQVVDQTGYDFQSTKTFVEEFNDLKCIRILSSKRLSFAFVGQKVCWLAFDGSSRVNMMDVETDILSQFGLDEYQISAEGNFFSLDACMPHKIMRVFN